MSRRSNPASARLADAVPLFAALGDRTRLMLVTRLGSDGPLSTVHLGAGAGITRQALTKQLHLLAAAGLVEGTRGRPRVWRLKPGRIEDARGALDRISRQWDEAISRLQALVED